MANKDFIIDPAEIDMDRIIADIEEIRKWNPQRHEMEHLTAIVHEDLEQKICAGYKDVTREEFWIRGHMPGMPLMPGVIMLEAAAQMCSFFVQRHDLLGSAMVGLGGLEEVRFREPVIPGDRLIVMCQLTKVRRNRMIVCRFQGVVRDKLAVDGILKGASLPVDMLSAQLSEG